MSVSQLTASPSRSRSGAGTWGIGEHDSFGRHALRENGETLTARFKAMAKPRAARAARPHDHFLFAQLGRRPHVTSSALINGKGHRRGLGNIILPVHQIRDAPTLVLQRPDAAGLPGPLQPEKRVAGRPHGPAGL
ncbi:MAG: hypothetical protein OEV08_11835 [Nitrospira sp.]|nr:hypothetical protein [Nitrospira sp.]